MVESSSNEPFGHRTVSHDLIKHFGELTGDDSAIHFDPEAGRTAGYGGPIAHGLLTACWAVGALAEHESEQLSIGDRNAVLSELSLRLSAVVRADDVFSVRVVEANELAQTQSPSRQCNVTGFETLNQHGERTSAGRITCRHADRLTEGAASDPWLLGPWQNPDPQRVLYAEDFLEAGPRGKSAGREITTRKVEAFVNHVGERNPIYLDETFSRTSIGGSRLVPPMLSFSLAFSDFLKDLLSTRMPSQGFAGHIGDHWRLLQPIFIGDTLQTRHRPLACTLSKSRPEMGIVRFGLQVVNQHDSVVQEGETIMMIPSRARIE